MSVSKTDEGLQRVVGVWGLALAIINGVIGAGIFALPAIVSIAMGAFFGIFNYIFLRHHAGGHHALLCSVFYFITKQLQKGRLKIASAN